MHFDRKGSKIVINVTNEANRITELIILLIFRFFFAFLKLRLRFTIKIKIIKGRTNFELRTSIFLTEDLKQRGVLKRKRASR